jgi:hypothetical protein
MGLNFRIDLIFIAILVGFTFLGLFIAYENLFKKKPPRWFIAIIFLLSAIGCVYNAIEILSEYLLRN